MSLPLSSLTFYRMADVSPASADFAGLLGAILTAGQATVDYRGTSLAATHLWTTTSRTNAVTMVPPTWTGHKSPAVIFAGATGAPTPTMASPDAFVASNLLIGICHTIGAWNAWDAASPFTSGTFSGYWRAAGTTWNATGAKVRMFISQEVVFIQLIGVTVTQQAWMAAGIIVEPHTSYATSTGLTSETDDRLYGMWATGGGAVMGSAWLNSFGTQGVLAHSTGAGAAHMMVFQPTTSSLFTCGRKAAFGNAAAVNETVDGYGAYVGDAFAVCRTSGSLVHNGNRLGTNRNMFGIGSMQSGKYLRNGTTDLYHVVAPDTGAVGDAMLLTAAA